MGAHGRRRRTAVVAGGSFCGLLAADALARAGWRVRLLERQQVNRNEPAVRLPQGEFVHVLPAGGWARLTAGLPELASALDRAGALPLDMARDVALHHRGAWNRRYPSHLETRTCSRALLEWALRSVVTERHAPGGGGAGVIEQIDGVEVRGLAVGPGRAVEGVRVVRLDGTEVTELADLVVDCTGRRSGLRRWFGEAGLPIPEVERLKTRTGYSCRRFVMPRSHRADWKLLYVFHEGTELPRAGIVYPIEGGRWLVNLIGAEGEEPPADGEAFLAFARTLAVPDLADALEGATPDGPIRRFRSIENRRLVPPRRRWPRNFVVMGDALCAFNPVYGQGITAAAIASTLLGEMARGPLDAHRFQRRLHRRLDPLWRMVALEDLRWPSTSGGRRGLGHTLLSGYVDRVHDASHRSQRVYEELADVIQLVKPPTALVRPACAVRVGLDMLRTAPP